MFSLHHSAFRRPAALLLWAAAACCACVKTQTLETPQELSLSAVASVSATETKANPELSGASLGTDNTYVIYASASAPGEPSFMAGQLFRYSTSDARWHASPDPVFWPLQGVSLDFLALAMKPAAFAALAPAMPTAESATLTEWDTHQDQYDVMYCVKNGQSHTAGSTAPLPLVFKHSMAVVGFTAKSTVDAAVYTIKSLELNGLQFKGTLTVDNSSTQVQTLWEVPDDAAHVGNKALTLSTPDFQVPFTSSATGVRCTDHMLVIPQPSRSVTLTYHVVNSIPDLTYTIHLPRIMWKEGRMYIYHLSFGPTEITVSSVTVTDWDGTPITDEETLFS